MSQTITDMVQVIIYNKWEIVYWHSLAYLYLILTHSKGHGQGHARFDNRYLLDGDI